MLLTDKNSISALITRLAPGIVVFPHGVQKLLG